LEHGRDMRAIFGLKVPAERLAESIEEARRVGREVRMRDFLPLPSEQYQEWSYAERRSARLLAAYVQGALDLREIPEAVALRLEELREELELGPWIKQVQRVKAALRPGKSAVEPKEAARRILQGRAVATSCKGYEYLEEVSREVYRLLRYQEVRQKVDALLTAKQGATLTPEDTRIIIGRLMDNKPVWVRASPEELEKLREQMTKALLAARPNCLPTSLRYAGDWNRPHWRLFEALRNLNYWVDGLEGEVVEGDRHPWIHRTVLWDYEIEILQALGVDEVDWTDPAETLVALRGLLERGAIAEEENFIGLSLAAQEAVGADAYTGVAPRPRVVQALRGMLRRLERRMGNSTGYKEGPQMAVRRFLQGFELASQGEVRRDHYLALRNDREALARAATQVMPMALEALIAYPALADEMVSLAWDFSVRAVKEQRSYNHHPAALAVRLIKKEGPLLVEARRQGLGLDQESLAWLQKLRRTRNKYPDWEPARYARTIRAPVDWVQAALPLLEGVYWLDATLDEEGELAPRDLLLAAGEEERERRIVVQQALKGLERAYGSMVREVVERVCMDGLPAAEVAEALGLEDIEPYLQKGLEFLRNDPILADLA